jgi:pimeloyl-ACP methyl ester carboxylesterase
VSGASFATGPRVETTDGVAIATYDLGGDGPPVLLAHATGFHGRVWLPVAATLRNRYHCWSFDGRGHGDSAPDPHGSYEWDGFGRDALAVVAGLGLSRPRAVGHSAGGAALLLAEEAEPGTFAALYCYEPVVPVSDGAAVEIPTGDLLAAGARRRREVFRSRRDALENYATKRPFNRFDPAVLADYVEWGFHDRPDGTVQLSCRGEDEARMYEAAGRHHGFERLPRVACPVTLASGGDRAHFGLGLTTALAERIAAPTTVEVLTNLGHFGPMERPQEVAASVLRAWDAGGAA